MRLFFYKSFVHALAQGVSTHYVAGHWYQVDDDVLAGWLMAEGYAKPEGEVSAAEAAAVEAPSPARPE